jgi:hypothetical protein
VKRYGKSTENSRAGNNFSVCQYVTKDIESNT